MSDCEAGPGCMTSCVAGCGCISKPDGTNCKCYCVNPEGELEPAFSFSEWTLDEPVLICLKEVDRAKLAAMLADAWSANPDTKAGAGASGLMNADKMPTTLRALGADLGLVFPVA